MGQGQKEDSLGLHQRVLDVVEVLEAQNLLGSLFLGYENKNKYYTLNARHNVKGFTCIMIFSLHN